MANEIIIDNLACFLASAKKDYSQEKLCDIAYSFYSHEEIKTSKEKILNFINKDIIWRRDPDKKMKDLNDLIDGINEIYETNKYIKCVADSYKKIPPVGLEFIAPILINLSEEVNKINSLLPGILDIKSTVLNMADTVRDCKVDLVNIKQQMQQSNDNDVSLVSRNSITPNKIQPNIENKIKTLRQKGICDGISVDIGKSDSKIVNVNNDNYSKASTECEITSMTSSVSTASETSNLMMHHKQNYVKVPNTSGSDKINENFLTPTIKTKKNEQLGDDDGEGDKDEDGWILVKRSKVNRPNNNKSRFKQNSSITGVKNSPNNKFRSADKTLDLFIGRVDNDVNENEITSYVLSNFNIKVVKIEKIDIKASYCAAFKLTINSNDRDTLLNPDKWPSGIIVNKFYKKF